MVRIGARVFGSSTCVLASYLGFQQSCWTCHSSVARHSAHKTLDLQCLGLFRQLNMNVSPSAQLQANSLRKGSACATSLGALFCQTHPHARQRQCSVNAAITQRQGTSSCCSAVPKPNKGDHRLHPHGRMHHSNMLRIQSASARQVAAAGAQGTHADSAATDHGRSIMVAIDADSTKVTF